MTVTALENKKKDIAWNSPLARLDSTSRLKEKISLAYESHRQRPFVLIWLLEKTEALRECI